MDDSDTVLKENNQSAFIQEEPEYDGAEEDHVEDGEAPPDGGWGWMVLLGSFMVHVLYDGLMYCSGVVLTDVRVHFAVGRTEIGWMASILSLVAYGPAAFYGMLLDRFGCRLLGIFGTLLVTLSLFISAFAESIWLLFITFGITSGIGFGTLYMSAIVAISQYFRKRLSMATGLAICGSGVGMLTIAPLNNWLLTLYSWRGALIVQAGLILQCCVFASLFRPLGSSRKAENTKPLQLKLNGQDGLQRGEEGKGKTSSTRFSDYKQVLCSPALHLITTCYVCRGFAGLMPYIFMPDVALTNGHSAEKAALALSVMGVGNLVGRAGIMWILDRPKANKLMGTVVITFINGVSLLLMPVVAKVYPLLMALAAVFGATHGVGVGMCSVLLVNIFQTKNIAFSLGYVNTAISFSFFLGSIFTGFLYDTFGTYSVPYFSIGSLVMVGSISLWLTIFTPEYKRSALVHSNRPSTDVDI